MNGIFYSTEVAENPKKSRYQPISSMKENVFTVDLGNVKLSDTQRKEINAAIQTSVTGVLAKTGISNEIVLFPLNRFPKGPILWGIIARPWKNFDIKSIEQVLR